VFQAVRARALAAHLHQQPALSELVESGTCDVNRVFEHSSILSYASDPDIVKCLLDANARINHDIDESVLKASCSKLQPQSVELLLNAGATLNGTTGHHRSLVTAIRAPCSDDQADIKYALINLILNTPGSQTRDLGAGASALHVCATSYSTTNRTVSAKALLEHDPSLFECRDRTGLTPLMQAVWSKHVDLVRFLVGRGADVFARDNTGMPVIFYVFCLSSLVSRSEGALRDMREIWRILVSAGADPRVLLTMRRYSSW
jgi:hypothetical protein